MFFFASPYWISVDFKILVHSIYLIWLSGSYNIPSFFLGLPKASKFWTILKRFFCNLLHIQTEGPIVFSRSAKIPWQKSGKKWGNEHQSIFKWILFSKNVLALQFSAKKSKQTDFFSCWLKYFFTASLFVTRALKCHPVEGFSWKFSLDSPTESINNSQTLFFGHKNMQCRWGSLQTKIHRQNDCTALGLCFYWRAIPVFSFNWFYLQSVLFFT